jgi:hypothetical protein
MEDNVLIYSLKKGGTVEKTVEKTVSGSVESSDKIYVSKKT